MTPNEFKALINWLRFEEGGRHSPPPVPNYSTVAEFEILKDKWPTEAWSVVLNITDPPDAEGNMIAGIRMLAENDASKELLSPGNKFELYEGKKCVARGKVL